MQLPQHCLEKFVQFLHFSLFAIGIAAQLNKFTCEFPTHIEITVTQVIMYPTGFGYGEE